MDGITSMDETILIYSLGLEFICEELTGKVVSTVQYTKPKISYYSNHY